MYALERLVVANYRCIDEPLTVEFDDTLTFLAGPNGSGKSTVLDAIQFLADWAGHGLERALTEERRGGRLGHWSYRGPELAWDPARPTRWEATLRRSPRGDAPAGPRRLRWTVHLHLGRDGNVEHERVEAEDLEGSWDHLLERDASGTRARPSTGAEWEPAAPHPQVSAVAHQGDPRRHPHLAAILDVLKACHLLRLNPLHMREAVPSRSVADPPDLLGRDLEGRLHGLLTERRHAVDAWLALLRPVASWVDLRLPLGGGLGRPEFREQGFSHYLPLALASDGQLAFAYLAALAAAPPSTRWTLLLDEPAVSLSRRGQADLESVVRHLADRHQVVVTSHATPLLDATGRRDNVWVLTRHSGEGSCAMRLADLVEERGWVPGYVRPGTLVDDLLGDGGWEEE